MTAGSRPARVAVDIGGTFTDVAVEHGADLHTVKVLTTPRAPEEGVMNGIAAAMEAAGLSPADVGIIIHGTTLATNALIERKGAVTALVVTEGFRDSVEMAYENRFEQYDIYMERPAPLVPRHLRLPVRERLNNRGETLIELDEDSVRALVPTLQKYGVQALAIGLLHAYANPAHEIRVEQILKEALPDLWITRASEVCPEIREYERQSTACANAYVQPVMARYLTNLDKALRTTGYDCPLFLMMSGGGITTLETAIANPIRLVESGPAGGAILASHIAAECGLDEVVSFDMGGTTAKICLIDQGKPQSSRTFEVARVYRFMKGSGLPLRIPVIEMVEIGAGGGSIAAVDSLKRITVGPKSAGSEPGPACYDLGGTEPTVTDADVALGRIDPAGFAGGRVKMDPRKAETALARAVGAPLDLTPTLAAFGVSEIVDENMANAARVHAVERGKSLDSRAMVAFGGAAPLHAARLAEKVGVRRVVVPTGAGVGSAIGFLRAPIAYEVVRSRYMKLSAFDADEANTILAEMHDEAEAVVRRGAGDQPTAEVRTAFMRYVGQGHEITVDLPLRLLKAGDADEIRHAFDAAYTALYGRTIPNMDVEILSWTLTLGTAVDAPALATDTPPLPAPEPSGRRRLFDAATSDFVDVPVYRREALRPGAVIAGPAIVAEEQTTTVVTAAFDAHVNALGYLVLDRRPN
ncbi:N-methylhydantoinase A [Constrictibacter sp. MBR-5]|jgi:N-methylhydantoinase A|uniref:hydantoinase/oxoprolinase family protein n=1 Tax=Constrictibacter sp. MBR-5 TaxID=3156467 RepID=UPI00339AABD6